MFNIVFRVIGAICAFVLFFSLFSKNGNYLDIRGIIASHLKLLFNGNRLQAICIFISPVIFAICIVQFRCLEETVLENLNVVLSILIAMLFSVLSILNTLNTERSDNYLVLLKETFTATAFAILVCLLLLVLSFVWLFVGSFDCSAAGKLFSGITYYLTIVVFLNIPLVIKRIQVLFDVKTHVHT